MFPVADIEQIVRSPEFQDDYASIRQSIVNCRLSQPMLLSQGAKPRLRHFVESVLASTPLGRQEQALRFVESLPRLPKPWATRAVKLR